jgi:hypothetical protein
MPLPSTSSTYDRGRFAKRFGFETAASMSAKNRVKAPKEDDFLRGVEERW